MIRASFVFVSFTSLFVLSLCAIDALLTRCERLLEWLEDRLD